MQFKPLNDYVLVERIPSPTTSKGGIVIAPASQEPSNLCKVLAVAFEDVYNEALDTFEHLPVIDVNIGDTVLIGKHAGQEFKWEGKDCVILKAEEIMAVEISEESSKQMELFKNSPYCQKDTDDDGTCPSCAGCHSKLS
jgi:chaperonin GroES